MCNFVLNLVVSRSRIARRAFFGVVDFFATGFFGLFFEVVFIGKIYMGDLRK